MNTDLLLEISNPCRTLPPRVNIADTVAIALVDPNAARAETSDSDHLLQIGGIIGVAVLAGLALYTVKGKASAHDKEAHQNTALSYAARNRIRNENRDTRGKSISDK